ncbi:MAG: Diphosphomevalonate decarboxylase [Candidatus Gottesmanbacteria bacterium GW2011_GWB1_43_11]|uniref:diphosphomevalonate decarboxylase n=1 Tax=Candidatus Gottesmanbacteria bacterium GW2011_GWB1_43_11 TaxID=1618446 RepID=A0A0G1CM44_9BACT|nr:MAG: Diphosphomevalonate decarboxylase [Candidatus Gottesmanbacteria bacterium GW2011_GWA2_42_16]KKS80752.1 MAG: Diphosphomevalonate decarboxylase [Candidatus Gottesmanbacteria bacterium GW2011_GWC1_43_10]KKS86582.1 MAG: Diphosphomevalonate decarboxylase [Candidatus Gottesmanbacteria bacterium GW2011_GWB1_43_11]OGG09728.1 MAG: diphosphomevalonate decarboxylase [Candidatus Gottesmanbacteria bacterium RIFCSPHIGHO2_01_FULL_43_15]HCM37779.1 diphosphomevalonate decarboxylase [Patescibacteria grou
MKATAVAPSNIAFIKYWGRKDEVLRLPENGSLSMNLSGLQTTTTVEFSPQFTEDYIEINGIREPNEGSRAIKHLDRVRALAKIADKAKVVTKNNFPIGTGLSSSASGFAALTVASAKAAGLNLSEKELSILARQGSGSACRSIPDGFVEWLDGDTSDASYAVSLYPPDYWDLIDVVAVVSEGRKDVPSSEGQKLVSTSPFFPVRKAHIQEKLALCKKILAEKNFTNLGELMEAEALEMHAVMLTSKPSLIYWTPGTLTIMKLTKKWRAEGISVYFTINTGQDIHLICESKTQEAVVEKLKQIPEVKNIIVNTPAQGAHLIDTHLF